MSETIEKKFNVSKPARLTVNNVSGSVNIRQGEEGTIQVTAIKHPFTGDEKRTEIEITQETDGSVKASTHFPDGGWSWIFGSHPCDVDYVISVPAQCSIKANGVSAPMILKDSTGISISIPSAEKSHSKTSKARCGSTLSAGTRRGKPERQTECRHGLGRCSGKGFDLRAINGKTVSGDIRISTPLTKGPYEFKSVSGDVQLKLPSETQCTVSCIP